MRYLPAAKEFILKTIATERLEISSKKMDGSVRQSLADRSLELDGLIERNAEALRDRTNEMDTFEFVESMKNPNTVKKTAYDMKKLRQWLLETGEGRDPEDIPPQELNLYIARMFLNVRKGNGDEFEPGTLSSMYLSFHRYLTSKDYPKNIISSQEFKHARDVLSSKKKSLKQQGLGNKKLIADSFTHDELQILKDKKLLGKDNPQSLINTMWLYNTIHFGLRGRQEHTDMLWGDFERGATATGRKYIMFTERATKTRNGVASDTRQFMPKMFEQPAHLPVHENLGKKRKLSSPNHFKNKRIQRIHDTTTSPPWTPLYSSALEQEALQYIHKFYCKDCQMDHQNAERARQAAQQSATSSGGGEDMTTSSAEETTVGTTTVTTVTEIKQEPVPPVSPQQTTDEGSIMQTLDKNKESLKRKLMMRRSLNELVDQGIYPPPKTPPAFMEQRKSLERAKIGDSLRFKISHRPDRQQLVQQHILEDTNIDPSLHERQRLLKKARLTDSLNDKLSHRPGILELVQGNILQTDGKLQQLIKEGSLSFDKTTDLTLTLPPNEDSKSSDEAFSPDQTDDSNISDISSPPIPLAPELPTSFAKSLPFSAQIQFSEESKVTLPSSSSPAFTIPQQVTTIGTFPLAGGSAVSGNVVSPRNNVTVTTINNNNINKPRPKKPKPKPQPKAKVIKFHEYKGPPNVVKSSQPVSSTVAAAVNVSNPVQAVAQGTNPDNTPYHILLQQQQLYLQWQLEFSQKNRNTVQTVLLPAQKELSGTVVQAAQSTSTNASSSNTDIGTVTVTTQSPQQTVFTVTPSPQHGQPPTPIQHIRIASPVLQIHQEAQVGQPQPQLNPNITPVPNKQVLKKPTPTILNGPPKQYASLEEMKVAELKAELKKRNLPVSGPKPQLIDRLKPYADSIIKNYSAKSPSSSVTSPGSSVMSVLSPPGSVKTTSSPLPFSVMSPPSSAMSPQSAVASSKTFVISPGNSSSSMTVPVAIVTTSSMFSPPGSVQSSTGSVSSPGSVHSASATSPQVGVSRPNSVLSRQGSVMSPLGSVIDETLTTNAVSPLPSIQSMQSAVSVSNMNLIPDDLSNPFSPPQSPLFIDSVMTPLSPDLMEIPLQSPQDMNNASMNVSHNFPSTSNSASEQVHNQSVNNMDQSRPPSVLSLAPSDMEKMDVDLDLTQSMSSGISVPDTTVSNVSPSIPPPPPLPQPLSQVTLANQTREVQAQQQLLQQIQTQLQRLQERQQQQLLKEQAQHMSTQMSQEELLRQQQEKIEKLQTQLEESQLRLQLQQLQHQQLQHQQKQLQQLQQQQIQKQTVQQQNQHGIAQTLKQQQQQQQQDMQQSIKPLQTHQPDITQVPKQHQQQIPFSSSPTTPQQHQHQASRSVPPVLTMAVQAQSAPSSSNTSPVQPVVTSPQIVTPPQPAVTPPNTVVAQPVPASTTASTTPLVFSLPNGNKQPVLTNLPPNMKQIQIPAHLLQAVQNQQGVPTVIVTQNTKLNSTKGKTVINPELFKHQALNQTLDLGGGKSLIAVTNTQTGAQQFIITTAPQNKPGTSGSSLNGITQPPVQKMATSLPTSPVNATPQQPVSRTSSNPFYIPMKEPPKYDDVVKQKPKKPGVESGTNNTGIKSQTMDDVLEILIRSGELPESAAQEPPPTPKTTTQTSTVTTVSVSNMVSSSNGPGSSHMAIYNQSGNTSPASPNMGHYNQSVTSNTSPASPNIGHYNQSIISGRTSPGASNIGNYNQSNVFSSAMTTMTGFPSVISSVSVSSGTDSNKNTVYFPMESTNLQFNMDSVKSEVKSEVRSPQPCCVVTTAAGPSTSDVTNSDDLFDLNEVINSDLTSMDWTSDTGFGDLDLTDTAHFNTGMDLMPNDNTLLSIPMAHSPHRSNHGSEPDLANLGLVDMDTNTNMQIDIPDWLDVIMPSTGLTPLSASAPVSFPSDPILTPTTHQEVLDLFSLDESDLNTPSDLNSGTSNGISSLDTLLGTTSG